MFKILKKEELSPSVFSMDIEAPRVAKKCQAGQFIILRVDEEGERIPLTIANFDREKGIINIVFQVIGASRWRWLQKKPATALWTLPVPWDSRPKSRSLTARLLS